MTPYYADDWLTIYSGDAGAVLATLPADSVDCVVTSPPYWGLRDYGATGQLGLERTPEEYVANMVAVFAEVRRVLKPSGTCWLNLGDSYNSSSQNNHGKGGPIEHKHLAPPDGWAGHRANVPGLKPKDLVGIPWRVAFALQADGWYLRSDIIWAKPNPMPESVTDRPTKAHEYLFLLTKSARYYFDADAVREANVEPTGNGGWQNAIRQGDPDRYQGRYIPNKTEGGAGGSKFMRGEHVHTGGRNIRSVWTIATRPYPGAHFAVFPPELPERCIKAGSSEKGVCPECGAPWERVVEVARGERDDSTRDADKAAARKGMAAVPEKGWESERTTTGWRQTCKCTSGQSEYWDEVERDIFGHLWLDPKPAVVLDPFAGSGTTGMVAQKLGRRAILIDLNPDYLRQQLARNAQTPLGLDVA